MVVAKANNKSIVINGITITPLAKIGEDYYPGKIALYKRNGEYYFAGPLGLEFGMGVQFATGPVKLVCTVDGKNFMTGEEGGARTEPGRQLTPGNPTLIKGWMHKKQEEQTVAEEVPFGQKSPSAEEYTFSAFTIGSVEDSVATKIDGANKNPGVVGFAIYYPKTNYNNMMRRDSLNDFLESYDRGGHSKAVAYGMGKSFDRSYSAVGAGHGSKSKQELQTIKFEVDHVKQGTFAYIRYGLYTDFAGNPAYECIYDPFVEEHPSASSNPFPALTPKSQPGLSENLFS